MSHFEKFPKIPRLSRDIIITEKIDGTNASIWIDEVKPQEREAWEAEYGVPICYTGSSELYNNGEVLNCAIRAGSRKRFISPENDNYGFARWVSVNATDLLGLGVGRHYGEWWGQGIQRNYGLKEKRFSLFNTKRWKDNDDLPECCHVVPVLYEGMFKEFEIDNALLILKINGSIAAPEYHNPEGIVIYHTAANFCFKKTIEHDEKGKETT